MYSFCLHYLLILFVYLRTFYRVETQSIDEFGYPKTQILEGNNPTTHTQYNHFSPELEEKYWNLTQNLLPDIKFFIVA